MFNLGKMFRKETTDNGALLSARARVIDVRTTEEFKSGHVDRSINIPLDALTSRIAEIKSWNKPVITVCRSGARSAAGADMLKKAGIEAHNGGGWTDFVKSVPKAGK